jgi:prephenate dehydrogenase
MTVKVAINGFGRIGRNVVRAIYESGRKDIDSRRHQRSRPGRDQRPSDALRFRAWPFPEIRRGER